MATLVDEVKEPGEYSVQWDARQTRSTESIGRAHSTESIGLASNYPTGMYFARMTATDESGKLLHQQVRKVLLMK